MADVGAWSARGKVAPGNGASKAFGPDIYIGGSPKSSKPAKPSAAADRKSINKLRKAGESRPKATQNVV